VVNSLELITPVQKQWRTISFGFLTVNAASVVGISKPGLETMRRDMDKDTGFTPSWPKHVMPALGPGADLDALNRRAIEVFAEEIDKLLTGSGSLRVGLWHFLRETMIKASSEAIWGPRNPFRDPEVVEAWRMFEAGFLGFALMPLSRFLSPKLYRAREVVAAALLKYVRDRGYETASGMVRKRWEHHHGLFGFTQEDFARGELGNAFATMGNSTPCALWVVYHVFRDPKVLGDVRREVQALVKEEEEVDGDGASVSTIDLANVKTACPILLSTFQEVLRYRAVNVGPRVLLDDATLDGGRILLKKGNMLMMPASVQHADVAAWGDDASEFDHTRFVPRKPGEPGYRKINRTAFRAFGGGHVLCPGRHFASTEIMALAALLALQFDIVPVRKDKGWEEPAYDKSPPQGTFPLIDEDIEVELRPRDPKRKWKVTFTGSDDAMPIVSEDIEAGGRGAV